MAGHAMKSVRRLSLAALVVACMHLVFGAIVRISGSGMGCGDNWPKCYGYWFPPFSRPDLIVEVSHRYLASILTLTVLSMAFVAFRNRRVEGVSGKGGPMRSAFGAVGAVFTAAILGGVTVKMGNAPWATVAHWLVAMTLLAMVAMTAIRAGALGGASSLVQSGTARAARSGRAAAVLAIFAVALGGLTAKYPGAAVGCTTVPMCGANPSVAPASVHVQLTHRTLALFLVLHLIGVVMMVRKRRATEAAVVVRAAHIALGAVLLQLVVASSMILFHLPPVLRSLHEATGVGIWLSCFSLAYLARRASRHAERSEGPGLVTPPGPTSLGPSVAALSMDDAGAPARLAEAAPVVVEAAPIVVEAAPIVVEAAPIVVEAAPIAVEVAPIAVEAGPIAVEAAPIAAEVPAIDAEVPAIDAEAASIDDRAGEVAFEPEELDWNPRRAKAIDEVDEFSLPPEPEAGFPAEPELQPVVEEVVADTSIVTPSAGVPKLSPLPQTKPAPTMAVIVARGADLL
jgi:heme A synthase